MVEKWQVKMGTPFDKVPFKVDNKTKYRFNPKPYANGEMDFTGSWILYLFALRP